MPYFVFEIITARHRSENKSACFSSVGMQTEGPQVDRSRKAVHFECRPRYRISSAASGGLRELSHWIGRDICSCLL
jgi:hypothetical protein